MDINSPVYNENNLVWDNLEKNQTFRPGQNGRYDLDQNGFFSLILEGSKNPFVIEITDDAFSDYENIQMDEGTLDSSQVPPIYLISSDWAPSSGVSGAYEATISFRYEEPGYNLSKSFVNCWFNTSPTLPDTYKEESQRTYHCLFTAYSGGYGFNQNSVSQTGGITIRNLNLFDEYGQSGFYANLSFDVDLPLNNCSLNVEAFLPVFNVTSELVNCSVTPDIPKTISGDYVKEFTFTAISDNYAFHSDFTSWEITNMVIDDVKFSGLMTGEEDFGYFYSSVTLRLRFLNEGDVNIKVTAMPFSLSSYEQGYRDGHKDGYRDGYNKGHQDGLVAGDSYGVWNWLKQAARTTGEFFNIPLLPGFSVGALVIALAGLAIIWLFIKGFLFK
jgi:hypothetical protein